MKDLTFTVKAHSENPTKTIVQARDFNIVVDEPPSLAGSDDGPNPVEYVLAALAGCLNVVGHIVAKEMGFSLQGIRMEFSGNLDPSKFAGVQTTERAGYKEIQVTMSPDTDADPATLERWLVAVEERCPVSDNLNHPTPVKICLGTTS